MNRKNRTYGQWLLRTVAVLIVGCLSLAAVKAQVADDEQLRGIYERAEACYGIGRIEEAQQLLSDNVKRFSGNLRQSAFRLLSLCSLGLDDNQGAEEYARLLLQENPYYSPTLDDPQRFTDMVERISGRGESTITTASSHKERLSEVPVPTTLITEQMIRDSGARNLQEVLAAYVPGMNIVDCNDDINIAMRGIFSNGQEKILIMLDGHRMNSYCTNTAAPDFSISLEKLKQIEVLRGPASSLYGGVALTAVVNLITKQGAEADGLRLKAGGGNYGQLKGDVLFGKRYYDIDVLVWASLYRAHGETRMPPASNESLYASDMPLTIGGIGNKPSYDFGLSLEWKDLRFMYNSRFSQVRSPYTISTGAMPYDYDRYRMHNGLKPGFATASRHADLRYDHQFGKDFSLTGTLTYDFSDLTHYQVIGEDTLKNFAELTELMGDLAKIFEQHAATSRYINGQEQTFGAQVKGDYNYINSSNHNGYLTFGAEFSHFRLDDVRYTVGYDYEYTTPENFVLTQIGKGQENSYNAFAQLKHHWGSLIFNAGLRYDHKVRYDKSRVNELSPRLAVIYVRPKWNVKFSYSKAFVDAPYLYQKINQFRPLLNGQDGESADSMAINYRLHPETLHSFQLTFAATKWAKGLDMELNIFHNRASELIFTEILTHTNSGQNKTMGAEFMANYANRHLTAHFNTTILRTFSSNLLALMEIDDNNSTPYVTSNLVVAWQALPQLRLSANTRFEGRQKSYNVSFVNLSNIQNLWNRFEMSDKSEEERQEYLEKIEYYINNLVSSQSLPSRITFDVGAEYRLGKATLRLDVHNIFNKKYNQSGMNTSLVPQRGRWFLACVSYDF